MTLVQSFVAYCKDNDMPSDAVMSAAFYVNHLKVASGRRVTTDEWDDLLGFVEPDVPPAYCPMVHA